MPGILKSTACQNCKNRRIKCDLNWPTCTPCQRRNEDCPGPSSLFKFVAEAPKKDKSKAQNEQVWKTTTVVKAESSAAALSRHHRQDKNARAASLRLAGSPSTSTSTSTSISTTPTQYHPSATLEDRIGCRLVQNLHGELDMEGEFTFRYMKALPARLPHNTCLRDATILFCSALADYRRQTQGSISTMREYGNALRSLQHALEKGEKAGNVDTLASVAMIGRAESFFDPTWKPFRQVHAEGILFLTRKLGPPKPGDDLHAGVLFENYEALIMHFISKGERNFLNDDGWWQPLQETSDLYTPENLRPHVRPMMRVCAEFTAKVSRLFPKLWMIRTNPHTPENKELASRIMKGLAEKDEEARVAWEGMLENAIKMEEFTEVEDPDAISGMSYKPKKVVLCSYVLMSIFMRTGLARIRYDLSALYGEPEADSLFQHYRDLCALTWKMTPYPLRMDRIFSKKTLLPLAISLEAADEKEREHILDTIVLHHSDQHRLPKDRTQLATVIMYQAMALTGRMPMVPG